MFVGQYLHTLDAKKRVVLPAKFRAELGAAPGELGMYVTLMNGKESSFLQLFPPEAWQKKAEHLEDAAVRSPEAEWFLRKFMWDAEFCRFDPQWRLMIPPRLVQGAALKRDIVVTGAFRWIEVWDREQWNRMDERLRLTSADLGRFTYAPGEGTRPS